MDKDYLKQSIKKNETFQKKHKKDTYINNTLLGVVERFMKKNKRICYGGTAINSILPKDKQFYDFDIDIPDYDFFSPTALEDAKALCNLFKNENVFSIESKNAVVYGTYKVFVNFVPIADCTQIDPHFYEYLLNQAIDVDGILYTPPSFLRMSLHQELARPLGDVSRWEKIYDRLGLLNLYFPIITKPLHQRQHMLLKIKTKEFERCYDSLFQLFAKEKAMFCNLHLIACVLKKYFKKNKCVLPQEKDMFLIYCNNLDLMRKNIRQLKLKHITMKKQKSIYKFIDDYICVYFKEKWIGILFQTNSCLSYMETKHEKTEIRVGNIDTIMNLYFSLLLMDVLPLNHAILLSVLAELNKVVIQYETLAKKGDKVLTRFNLPCYGEQDDFQSILQTRQKKYRELKNSKSSIEYKRWFFKYTPNIKDHTKTKKKSTKKNNKTKKET